MSETRSNGRNPYDAYLKRRQDMRVIAEELRNLRDKLEQITDPRYTVLSHSGVAAIQDAVRRLEAKLTLLATTPYNDEREETDER